MRDASTLRTRLVLAAILVLGLALRLYGIHDPIIDHPGWRQGDEAAIARNFAQLQDNIFAPQTDYDGPPPNYVELELQIVPFAAAQLYRVFGVHEIFARLIVVAFSLGTVLLLYFFGKELFGRRAGLIAALCYAIAPGAVYYGRTITPDSDMVFFVTGTLLFWWRWCKGGRASDFWWATAFGAFAWLAKPPALLALAPIIAVALVMRGRKALTSWHLYAFLALTLVPFFVYFHYESAIAEWHWAEGITSQHVLPQLAAELTKGPAFVAGLQSALALLRMLGSTILGPALFGLTAVAGFALPRDEVSRARAWLFGAWAVALAAYTLVVVNVERVDYYLLPWIPFAALLVAGAADNVIERLATATPSKHVTAAARAGIAGAIFVITYANMLQIHSYYTWSRPVYSAATELDRVLDPDCLIVMGHLDPSVLYTIGRKGWEEDPLQWNVHDQTSAIEKGACYYVAIEIPRLRANPVLYHFLQRYRRVPVASGWQVYDMRHFARRPAVKARAAGSASRTAPAAAPSLHRSSPSPGTPRSSTPAGAPHPGARKRR
ncbi:MAG TPA: glycosyltransferase family 39 protein [Candidatus Eremiobacteraceae bacterium]|nr:glycosyltransferase family 39 protein [Candidatus Eremiobacteraceae bacterium]